MLPTGRALVLMLGLLLLSASCATASKQHWAKAGAADGDLGRDRYACVQESRIPYGQGFGGFSAVGSPPSAWAGWGSATSFAQGGDTGGFVFLGQQRRAQSEANRLFDLCMQARGWRALD